MAAAAVIVWSPKGLWRKYITGHCAYLGRHLASGTWRWELGADEVVVGLLGPMYRGTGSDVKDGLHSRHIRIYIQRLQALPCISHSTLRNVPAGHCDTLFCTLPQSLGSRRARAPAASTHSSKTR